ncbi:uncharacterized protein LOC135468840 [Liolophura sinensis]|uniref:uncharacterized protein LOC135468840 n=1 Tax=Liolophura sinensis TaxID=3198878 RepID=UPI003158C8E8
MFSYMSMSSSQTSLRSVNVPPPAIQARVIQDPHCKSGEDVWEYAISRSWLNKWASLAAPATSQQHRPSNEPIGPLVVREIDVENCYIGESVWSVLLSWHGLDGGSYKRRRHVNPGYMPLTSEGGQSCHVLADRHLDILMVTLCGLSELDSPDKHHILQLYAWDTVTFWEDQFRQRVGLPEKTQLRIWLIAEHDDNETCVQLPQSSQCSMMQHLCQVCPELVHHLVQRQGRCPAPEHQAAFSSFKSTASAGYLSADPEDTKSYLFQELLLQRYKISIAVESVVQSQPGTDLLTGIGVGAVNLNWTPTGDKPPSWENRLKEVLDQIATNMHGIVDGQREKVGTVCKDVVRGAVSESERLGEQLREKIQAAETKGKSLSAQEKDINERETVLNEKLKKFKKGLADFLIEKKRLEEEMRKIEEMNKIAESKIKLNVGGHKFETSLDTMTKDPQSVLGFMFSGRHPIKREADGSYFIDRDGTNFRHILNFLRDGDSSFSTMPADVKALRELQKEADFYKLSGLIDFLSMKVGS